MSETWRERSSHHNRRRSRSPDRRDNGHRKRQRHSSSSKAAAERDRPLPYNARLLSKHDLKTHQALFGLYLDIQKEINIDDLDEAELKGRWKSFVNKWNRQELSEGYYDPATKSKADSHVDTISSSTVTRPPEKRESTATALAVTTDEKEDDDDDDAYGPSLPRKSERGAAIATRDDLLERDELNEVVRNEDRQRRKHERKAEDRLQKDRLDELAPRAEPGTRERQLEKKRERAQANKSFREARSPGAEEIRDGDLMGGDDDGIEGYKAKAKADQRRKTEREMRKEEILRARTAEREERMAAHRAKEDQTMEKLRALARERFG